MTEYFSLFRWVEPFYSCTTKCRLVLIQVILHLLCTALLCAIEFFLFLTGIKNSPIYLQYFQCKVTYQSSLGQSFTENDFTSLKNSSLIPERYNFGLASFCFFLIDNTNAQNSTAKQSVYVYIYMWICIIHYWCKDQRVWFVFLCWSEIKHCLPCMALVLHIGPSWHSGT